MDSFKNLDFDTDTTLNLIQEALKINADVWVGYPKKLTYSDGKASITAQKIVNSDLSFEHYVGFDPAALTKTVTVASGKKDRKQMFYWIPEEYLDVLKKKKKILSKFVLKKCLTNFKIQLH